MPSKHIPDDTWREVEKETVRAVISTHKAIKDTELLNILIKKGLEAMKDNDYKNVFSDK